MTRFPSSPGVRDSSTGRPPQTEWDVFLSYSRSDAEKTGVLVSALRDRGLRVFVDDTAVDDFASITATIIRALAHSKVLVALYSADYPRRRACQWELTYAYLSGQREGDPRRRTLIVNPEHGTDHVHPVELRDARHWPWPTVPEEADRLADRVASHTAALADPMGHAPTGPTVPWLPAPARTGTVHFVGRLTEQWRLHTALHRHRAPLVNRSGTGRSAQLRGMPGIGKSALAQEYALGFSSAYPGGIFWFDLQASQGPGEARPMDLYADQLATVVSALGLGNDPLTVPDLLSRLAVYLGERNAPCLWVVDGVPDGLTEGELHLLRGPHLLAATLIATRSLRFPAFAEPIDLSPLPDADSYVLIGSLANPRDDLDRAAALALVHDVGGHPQALGLIARLAAATDFRHARNRLHSPGTDVLASTHSPGDRWGEPPSETAQPPLASILLARPLSGHGPVNDVLRLFALACPAALSQTTLENVLSTLAPYDPWEAAPIVTEAVETLLGSGSLRPAPGQDRSWTIHPLLARAVRRHDVSTARQEDLRRMFLHALGSSQPTAPARTPDDPMARHLSPPPAPSKAEPSEAPGPVERAAAFDLQVELVTRVGVQPLAPGQGSLREALNSLHSLFSTTREVLHRVATETTTPLTLPAIASNLANRHLRPFLSNWHPSLQEHEATRAPGTSPTEHERHWDHSAQMRTELAALRDPLTLTVRRLATLCGIDLLAPVDPPG
ncbi:TIR domain-containing protein [Streptomyces sp. Ncost-T6T-1]|uniref:toll/interleukin-1 receptor domain-containing protein n=1 Tax=Streptomyces sp. Ncost-T6T-1 TaxID=1100828 RepID=UPI000805C9AC|nr:toll/interleukin-1 receptor domain-containing protein [Streptomyces sp. Ncost-T6T-1]SBU96122.1 TIR domain-containing protein [Streptomyces sp. Ncost-T6T-1]